MNFCIDDRVFQVERRLVVELVDIQEPTQTIEDVYTGLYWLQSKKIQLTPMQFGEIVAKKMKSNLCEINGKMLTVNCTLCKGSIYHQSKQPHWLLEFVCFRCYIQMYNAMIKLDHVSRLHFMFPINAVFKK